MRLLIQSRVFSPSVGGVETVTEMLAEAFAQAGHAVTVVTETPAADGQAEPARPFAVLRRPSPGRMLREVAACDVLVHSCLSLRAVWPLLLVRRPWAVITHVWLGDGLRGRLKRAVLARADLSVCVSRALAEVERPDSLVIPNPYRDTLFRPDPTVPRDRDLVFVGRLVSDKGCDVALRALARLHARGLRSTLTVVGDGPKAPALRRLAEDLTLAGHVTFTGALPAADVRQHLTRHRVLVVPSRWNEPFGLVAIEGIACGCAVAGTAGGGLRDAIGPCGLVVAQNDAPALADAAARLLTAPEPFLAAAPAHLGRHRATAVAAEYLAAFAALLPAEARQPA